MAAELLDPAAKSIYKGKDALAEYGSGEYWNGVVKAGLTGMAVSGVYGGAFDVMAGGVKAGDINAAKADINATVMQSENLKEKNRFTEDRAKRADSQTLGNLKIIENVYRWNYFYTPVQIGEEIVGVRIAVRDIAKGVGMTSESQIYNWGIKKDVSLDGERRDPKAASPDVSSDTSLDTSLGGVQPVVSNSSHDASSDVSDNSISENTAIVKLKKQECFKKQYSQKGECLDDNTRSNDIFIIESVILFLHDILVV